MSYPAIPLVYATFLGRDSEERLAVHGKLNVTILVHNGENLNYRRLEIKEDSQWGNVAEQAAGLYNEGPVQTAAVFYPADGDEPVDFGLLLRPSEPPLGLMWTYGPKFDLQMAPPNIVEQISNGAGIELLQGMLDSPNKLKATGQE